MKKMAFGSLIVDLENITEEQQKQLDALGVVLPTKPTNSKSKKAKKDVSKKNNAAPDDSIFIADIDSAVDA